MAKSSSSTMLHVANDIQSNKSNSEQRALLGNIFGCQTKICKWSLKTAFVFSSDVITKSVLYLT